MAELIKGALYVIAVEIEDVPTWNEDTHEGIMRVLQGAIRSISGGGGVHGQEIKFVQGGSKIMRYALHKDDDTIAKRDARMRLIKKEGE